MADKNSINELATGLLEKELEIKGNLVNRIVSESDIKPSRIPAPMNITEIGGYFNLMMKLKKEAKEQEEKEFSDMLKQTLSSILGLPVQTPTE
jgi:hypothetical protein